MAFDVITPVFMGSAELTASLVVIRTTPSGSVDLVKNIDIANNGTAAAKVTVHMVESGDTADDSNVLIPTVSIPAKSILQWSGVQIMDAQTAIKAKSTSAGVGIRISGGNGA